MLTEKRYELILELLDKKRSVTVPEIKDVLGVSESTIRRDLNALDKAGRLTKVFGGAVSSDGTFTGTEPSVAQKMELQQEEKRRIAQFAAGLILSGAFIPVSEDQGMIDAVSEGALTIEKLEAMTCVCSVGLDMIAIPGDTKASTIAGIIADESAIGMINQKTTAVRVIPVIGKGVGETVEFGGLLGYAPIMPVNQFSCEAFVERGGRIPAPIHSFKN